MAGSGISWLRQNGACIEPTDEGLGQKPSRKFEPGFIFISSGGAHCFSSRLFRQTTVDVSGGPAPNSRIIFTPRSSPPSTMASSEDPVVQAITDNDRLITMLQTCFSDLLREHKEQTDRLVEELKPKPLPATDKKTAFWNTYKTLADEHDKELLQRYSTDLDTSLIFAGLFSAVDSAFIIQIQPEFQSSEPPLVTLVAQSLLYISLGSTLLAALLAVLGKQWLMFYSAAGERGTLETRGLERQRKLDGLRKWKFETIMQTFPLLLQFALFVFAAALSVYLWKIHHVLAFIVLGLTSFGTAAYISPSHLRRQIPRLAFPNSISLSRESARSTEFVVQSTRCAGARH
ncbi:hypothetical protein MVEN_01582000 [Mycena venus]|uniref:DUF6535 domain-containing protein n=1 Tax=Mycena venus TaxID=2733690 RepID=A0A8H7CSA2_9AGAR|nr:hypothetical protein MVEN_01582000 [Mycena venus]